MTDRQLFAWLWRSYLRPYAGLLAIAALFMAIEGSMFGLLSWMMKPMFDRVFIGGDGSALVWVGFAVMGIFMLRAVASVVQKVILKRVSEMSMADMRQALLEHMMRLDPAFHSEHGPGYLIQRIEGDVGALARVWNTLLTGAGRDVVALISLFGVALAIDWRWTLVALVGVPLLLAPAAFLQRFVRGNARQARDVAARLSTRLNEVFLGIIPVKLNALERYQAQRYHALTRDRIRLETRSALGQASLPGLIDIMSGIGFVGVLIYGGGEILSGEKTVGDFVCANCWTQRRNWPSRKTPCRCLPARRRCATMRCRCPTGRRLRCAAPRWWPRPGRPRRWSDRPGPASRPCSIWPPGWWTRNRAAC